jgi:hypothetical protein
MMGTAVDRVLSTDGYREVAQRISRDIAETTPLDTIADVLAQLGAVELQPPVVSGA